jgi:anti-sigma factor (TIGR02949 family)
MTHEISRWIKKNLVTRYIKTECPERRKCLQALEEILDNEAPEDMESEYKAHIDQCWSCFQDYKLERAIRELIKIKLERKPVPDKLLEVIKTRISESE